MTPQRALKLIDEFETLRNAFNAFLATEGRQLATEAAVRLSNQTLAHRVGVSPSRISRIITGRDVLTGEMLLRILTAGVDAT